MTADIHNDFREAASWFAVRRRGVMSLSERANYEAWLRDPANRASMARMENIWTMLGLGDAVPARPRGRAAMLAVMCAASLAICVLSLATNSHFWTALDWTSR